MQTQSGFITGILALLKLNHFLGRVETRICYLGMPSNSKSGRVFVLYDPMMASFLMQCHRAKLPQTKYSQKWKGKQGSVRTYNNTYPPVDVCRSHSPIHVVVVVLLLLLLFNVHATSLLESAEGTGWSQRRSHGQSQKKNGAGLEPRTHDLLNTSRARIQLSCQSHVTKQEHDVESKSIRYIDEKTSHWDIISVFSAHWYRFSYCIINTTIIVEGRYSFLLWWHRKYVSHVYKTKQTLEPSPKQKKKKKKTFLSDCVTPREIT